MIIFKNLNVKVMQMKTGPKKREKHHSFDETVDEPAKLIEDETVAIETEAPIEENEPVEDSAEDQDKETSAFEEE